MQFLQRAVLVESSIGGVLPSREVPLGLYGDGRDFSRAPLVTYLRHSDSLKYLCVGTSEGSIVIKPTECTDVCARTIAHASKSNPSQGGVTSVKMSYDDMFVLSCGVDGTLSVHRYVKVYPILCLCGLNFVTQLQNLVLSLCSDNNSCMYLCAGFKWISLHVMCVSVMMDVLECFLLIFFVPLLHLASFLFVFSHAVFMLTSSSKSPPI